MKEIWKTCHLSTNYEISSLGRVKRLKRTITHWNGHKNMQRTFPEIIVKLGSDKDGYLLVGIDGKTKRVHRLQAFLFLENNDPENKTQVNHINGVKDDNNITNLEWVTPSRNYQHAYDNLLNKGPLGPKNGASVLDRDKVLAINGLIKDGVDYSTIADKFKISNSTVSSIKLGKTWSHVTRRDYNGRIKARKK